MQRSTNCSPHHLGARQWLLVLFLLLVLLFITRIDLCLARESDSQLIDSIQKYDQCVLQSTNSFIYEHLLPPTTLDGLKRMCSTQSEGFKCVRDKTKRGPALLRRGLLAYVNGRARFHKKVCTNINSEASKKFIEASKCALEKRTSHFKKIDEYLLEQLRSIAIMNYNESAPELKQICCTFHNTQQRHLEAAEKECQAHAGVLEELTKSVMPSEINILCEDTDKLAKVCPKLEPIRLDAKQLASGSKGIVGNSSAAALGLYLVATLGEPQEVKGAAS